MPKTLLGKWSVKLIIVFFLFLAVFYLMVTSGQRGGDLFFSNLWLTVPMLIAAASGIAAFITGIVSIIKNRERSILVFISTALGLFILLFVSAEILFPH